MAGIYIHIPFCKTRCIYCDFYSTTRSELKQQYIRALCTELKTRKGYLKEEPIETIYFGGGTPSQLAHEDFEQIFRTIKEVYGTEHAEEITLEANPDDLTETVEPPAQCRASHRSHTPPPPSRLPEYQHRPHLWATG